MNSGGLDQSAGPSSSKRCKTEPVAQTEEDLRYEDWAKKLAAKPPNTIGLPNQQGQGLNAFGQTTTTTTDSIPANNGYDRDSAIGRFAWHIVEEEKYVPALYRNGELYCCVRMIEASILGDLTTALPQDIYDSAKLKSEMVSSVEAKLLNYINNWHCDGFFGQELFSTSDLLVTIEELEAFYKFLTFAYKILLNGGKNVNEDFSRCGFVKVNQSSLIPYALHPEVYDMVYDEKRKESDEDKLVPLIYFEGQVDILKEKAKMIGGWPLAYLKLCCKIQGVRKDLVAGDEIYMVKLTELKNCFPKRSAFIPKHWLPGKGRSLLPKPPNANSQGQTGQSQNQGQGSMTNGTMSVKTFNPRNYSNENIINKNRLLTNLTPASASTATATPASAILKQMSHTNTNANGTIHRQTHQLQQIDKAKLAKFKIASPPADISRINVIQEHPDGVKDGAYTIKKVILENNEVYAVNSKPFKQDVYLILLKQFMDTNFTNMSVYPTAVSVLKNLGISTYLPNSAQIRTFNKIGFSIQRNWEIPLISASEVLANIGKMKSFFKTNNLGGAGRQAPMQAIVTNSGYSISSSNTFYVQQNQGGGLSRTNS